MAGLAGDALRLMSTYGDPVRDGPAAVARPARALASISINTQDGASPAAIVAQLASLGDDGEAPPLLGKEEAKAMVRLGAAAKRLCTQGDVPRSAFLTALTAHGRARARLPLLGAHALHASGVVYASDWLETLAPDDAHRLADGLSWLHVRGPVAIAACRGLVAQLVALALSGGDGSNIAALAKRTFAAILRTGRDAAAAELAATALGAARDAAAAGDAADASARWLLAACWAAVLLAPSPAEHVGAGSDAAARTDASLSELAAEGAAAAARAAAAPPPAADGCGGRPHVWSAAYEALIGGVGGAGAAERLANAALAAELRPVAWFHFLGVADALARGGGVGRSAVYERLLVALPRAQREALAPSALALAAACWAARPLVRLDASGAWASRAARAGAAAADASAGAAAAGARSDYAHWWLQHLAHTHTAAAAAAAAEGAPRPAEAVVRTDDAADCAAPRRYAAAVVRALQLMLVADSEAEQREWVRAHLKLARLVVKAGAAGGSALGSALGSTLDDYISLAAARLAELQASADGCGEAVAAAAAHEQARGLERAHALVDAFGSAGADGERRMVAAARNLALFSKALFKTAVLPALVRLCCRAADEGGGAAAALSPARREQLLGALVEHGLASSEAVVRLRAECGATAAAAGPAAAPPAACVGSDDEDWSEALAALVRRARAPTDGSPPRRALRRLAHTLARDEADDSAGGARLPPSARAEALLNGWLCALACGAPADGGAPSARRERSLYEELLLPTRAQPQMGAAVWARLRDLCGRAGPAGSLGAHHAAALALLLLHWAALPLSPAAAAAAAASGRHGGTLRAGAVGGGAAGLAGARAVCALLAELPAESSAELQWAVRLSLAYARAAVSAGFDAILLDVDLPAELATEEALEARGGARGSASAPLALAAVMPAALPARLRGWCAALLQPARVPPPSSAAAALVDMARCALRESALAALAAHTGNRACAPAADATGGGDARAAVVARVWAALADADDADDAADDREGAGAQRWAQAARHCSARTVWVDSWLGGHALPRGVAGLRALHGALRDALGVGWALSGFALDARADADDGRADESDGSVGAVLTCAGVAVGACGRVPFRATFQLEAARAGPPAAAGTPPEPPLDGSQPAPLISMAAISWDVLALGGAAPRVPAVADEQVARPCASPPIARGGGAAAPPPARAALAPAARPSAACAHHFKFV